MGFFSGLEKGYKAFSQQFEAASETAGGCVGWLLPWVVIAAVILVIILLVPLKCGLGLHSDGNSEKLPDPSNVHEVAVGVEGGAGGGVLGDTVGGVVGGAPSGVVVDDAPPLRVGGGVSRPEKISGSPPVYTEVARRARVTGVVIVEAIIDENGNVTDARVLKGLPMGLDRAALDAVQDWKFKPAQFQGRNVKVYYTLTVNFQVQNTISPPVTTPNSEAASAPPAKYVSEGACPFECCTYREWQSIESVKLYASPETSSEVIYTTVPQEWVTAVGGFVQTEQPGRIRLKADVTDYHDQPQVLSPGEVLATYHYLGEGCWKVWRQKEMTEICPSDYDRLTDPATIWWARLRTRTGVMGWTNKPDTFDNKDACG